MENKLFNKIMLVTIAVGVWLIVLQNFGIFNEKGSAAPVRIVNAVGIEGPVTVEGSVEVGNTVDINISEINGYRNFYDHNYNKVYDRLPVYGGN